MTGPNVSDYYDVDYSGLVEYDGPVAAAEQPTTTALASPASMASSLAAAGDGGGGLGSGGLGSMGGVSVHGHQIHSEVSLLDFGNPLANASSYNATGGDLMMDPTTAAMATHVVKSVTLVSIILLAIFSNLLVIIRDPITEQKMHLAPLPFVWVWPTIHVHIECQECKHC